MYDDRTNKDFPGDHAIAILNRLPETPLIGAEVGVYRGMLSRWLLWYRPQLTLLMVDLWAPLFNEDYLNTGDGFAYLSDKEWEATRKQAAHATEFSKGRGRMIVAESAVAASQVADGILDFAFIDDDHSTAGCLRSIKAWLPKVKSGGWIGGHDYGDWEELPHFHSGVKAAVDEFFAGRKIELDIGHTWFVRV